MASWSPSPGHDPNVLWSCTAIRPPQKASAISLRPHTARHTGIGRWLSDETKFFRDRLSYVTNARLGSAYAVLDVPAIAPPADVRLEGVRVLLVHDQSPSVSQALEVARTLTPNGLLADVAMPGEHGYDLIEPIRAAAEPELHGMAAARTDGVFEYRRARGLRRLPTADA